MIGLNLPDVKTGASHLFARPSFDYFLLKEAVITTSHTTTIDGTVKKDFFSTEELEALRDPDLMEWKSIRPLCFSIMKGKRLPLFFQIALSLSRDNIHNLIRQAKAPFTLEQIGGLYLNFRYSKGSLSAVSAISLNTFSLDRRLEQLWDDTVKKLFRQLKIPFEES